MLKRDDKLSRPVLKHGPNTASRKTGVNARQTMLKHALPNP